MNVTGPEVEETSSVSLDGLWSRVAGAIPNGSLGSGHWPLHGVPFVETVLGMSGGKACFTPCCILQNALFRHLPNNNDDDDNNDNKR